MKSKIMNKSRRKRKISPGAPGLFLILLLLLILILIFLLILLFPPALPKHPKFVDIYGHIRLQYMQPPSAPREVPARRDRIAPPFPNFSNPEILNIKSDCVTAP